MERETGLPAARHDAWLPAEVSSEPLFAPTDALSHQDASPLMLARAVLDGLPWSAALVAADLSIKMANRSARTCEVMAAFHRHGARPSSASRMEVDPGLARSVRTIATGAAIGPIRLRVRMPGRFLPTCVVVRAIPGLSGSGPLALLIVHDPAAPHAVDRALLGHLFGLTPAEARVAARIVEGQSPDEVAAESGTSIQTVRTQIQAVYSKLSVNRQAVLVRMLTCLPTAL